MRDASLNIYVSDDLGCRPDAVPSCAWRDGRSCGVPASVMVHLAEIDDGDATEYCPIHAEVMVAAAVTRLWGRFRAAPTGQEAEQ